MQDGNWCTTALVHVAVPKYCYMDRYFLRKGRSSDAIPQLGQIPPTIFFEGWGGWGEVNKRSTWRPYPHFSRRLPLPRNKSCAQKDAAGTLISLHSDFRKRGLCGCRNCELEFAHHRSLSEKQTKDQIIYLNALGRPEIPNVFWHFKINSENSCQHCAKSNNTYWNISGSSHSHCLKNFHWASYIDLLPLGRPGRRWENKIKIDCVECIVLFGLWKSNSPLWMRVP